MDDDVIDNEDNVNEHNDIDFDKRSVISNKTIKSLVSKKKDKMKLKRQFLLKRKFIQYRMLIRMKSRIESGQRRRNR